MPYNEFVFEDYRYDPARSTLSLCYSYNGGPRFEEQLIFDFVPQRLSSASREVLDRIFRLILLLSGVSYYKAFIPKILTCRAFELDEATTEFLEKFYEKGLAEFAFRNGVSLHCHFRIQSTSVPAASPITVELPRRTCVPVGGGKDSIVTIECLRQGGEPVLLFSLGDAEPIAACIRAAQLPFIRVHRRLDAGLLQLNEAGALNGHVPITGILSAIALACAVLSGCNAVAMSNEPAPQTSASMGSRLITSIASPSNSSVISLDMSNGRFRRASAIFLCCGHCRRSRSPEGSRNTRRILASFEAATRHSGKLARHAGVTGAAIVPNAVSFFWRFHRLSQNRI